mmetsp:Transcript_57850/g.134765  ORF Transcript_57850/g.134765 Transcript_57850/m.134765 type:complete len:136 (-) Transcript_57850:127-534(-)
MLSCRQSLMKLSRVLSSSEALGPAGVSADSEGVAVTALNGVPGGPSALNQLREPLPAAGAGVWHETPLSERLCRSGGSDDKLEPAAPFLLPSAGEEPPTVEPKALVRSRRLFSCRSRYLFSELTKHAFSLVMASL